MSEEERGESHGDGEYPCDGEGRTRVIRGEEDVVLREEEGEESDPFDDHEPVDS